MGDGLPREALIAYVGQVHARTYEAVELVDDARVGWRPAAGEFSLGELARHIASARRMNIGTIMGKGTRYRGHEVVAETTAADLRRELLRSSKSVIAGLHGTDLLGPVKLLSGAEAPGWRLALAGLIEHEVHHRSQLCDSLRAAGIEPPPLYGLHVEDLPR